MDIVHWKLYKFDIFAIQSKLIKESFKRIKS